MARRVANAVPKKPVRSKTVQLTIDKTTLGQLASIFNLQQQKTGTGIQELSATPAAPRTIKARTIWHRLKDILDPSGKNNIRADDSVERRIRGGKSALDAFVNVLNTSSEFSPDHLALNVGDLRGVKTVGEINAAIIDWYKAHGWTVTSSFSAGVLATVPEKDSIQSIWTRLASVLSSETETRVAAADPIDKYKIQLEDLADLLNNSPEFRDDHYHFSTNDFEKCKTVADVGNVILAKHQLDERTIYLS